MEIGTINEIDVIEKAKRNPSDFEPIYNHYFDAILNFVNKRINDSETAFDITQQVFFNALTHLKGYKNKGHSFSSYLFKIAINECNRHFRDQKKARFLSITDESIQLISEEIELDINQEIALSQLSKVLNKLKHDQLNIIELRFFEIRSFREISEILGISENNCKVKVHRIIKKLKKKIIKHEE